ncbi:DUF2283 domain-containing protein [Nocardia arthritidis]|nr:DUF2283 domain-containing protein [Nocardia arthritidis]
MQADFIDYLTWDVRNDVAYLALRQNRPGDRHSARTMQVTDDTGAVVAVLDFGPDGELIGIEFLAAQVQLGNALKAAARVAND